MEESLLSDTLTFARRYPATQRVIKNLEKSVAAAGAEGPENELTNLKASLMEALMDGFLLLEATPTVPANSPTDAGISRGAPEADITTLATALAEAPRLRSHHAGILLAVLTDIANQTRAALEGLRIEKGESDETAPMPSRKLELTSALTPRSRQYYEAFQSVWRDSLCIQGDSSELKAVKYGLKKDQNFAIRFLVFARVAEADLGTAAGNKDKLKAKIEELVTNDSNSHREAIAKFFPRLKPDLRKSFYSTAKRELGRDGSNWWEQLEKLL